MSRDFARPGGVCFFTDCQRGFTAEGNKLLLCSGCKFARYCGKDHQKRDWRRHKKKCAGFSSQSKDTRTRIVQLVGKSTQKYARGLKKRAEECASEALRLCDDSLASSTANTAGEAALHLRYYKIKCFQILAMVNTELSNADAKAMLLDAQRILETVMANDAVELGHLKIPLEVTQQELYLQLADKTGMPDEEGVAAHEAYLNMYRDFPLTKRGEGNPDMRRRYLSKLANLYIYKAHFAEPNHALAWSLRGKADEYAVKNVEEAKTSGVHEIELMQSLLDAIGIFYRSANHPLLLEHMEMLLRTASDAPLLIDGIPFFLSRFGSCICFDKDCRVYTILRKLGALLRTKKTQDQCG